MIITVNGESHEIEAGASLLDLLQARGYRVEVIAVEYNGRILAKTAYGDTTLQDGDRLEVVSFVGGG